MTIRVGDAVFIRSGTPAVVKDRNPGTAALTLNEDYEQVQEDMRHGYINGLSQENRAELYSILDDVKETNETPEARVEAMRVKLAEFEQDPTKLALTRYLRGEMLHLMNAFSIKPKQYSINEIKAR